ncbi:transglutaminase N-terminal domain-containing protein [Tepidamorphus sp. 3E244]|uniref:transglutaminase family protein n=1 Tax=Tepidamorphus sp. 3E244 TaxID=3385498 RepID=UPI0038FC5274
MKLRIRHFTEYTYTGPVEFGTHRLMLRPRDGHDLRVIESYLTLSPPAKLAWHFDTFGNSVAVAQFEQEADKLTIQSDLLIHRYPQDAILFGDRDPIVLPVAYSPDDVADLAPFMGLGNPIEREQLEGWLNEHFADRPKEAVGFMQALSRAINQNFEYSRRDELGTQTVAQTIENGGGTCRDYAFFFMEAVRNFGFAARFVTGYLYDEASDEGLEGGGATHAWADVFLPEIGWVEFDPTNRITGGAALIRVATTRTPEQASPITGTFHSKTESFSDMHVAVTVSRVDDD